jgi:hypothetical protein
VRFDNVTRDRAQARAEGLDRLSALIERHRARFSASSPTKAASYAAKVAGARAYLVGEAGQAVAASLQREADGRRMSAEALAYKVIEKHEAEQAAAFALSDIEREAAARIAKAKSVADVTAILAEAEQACAAIQ